MTDNEPGPPPQPSAARSSSKFDEKREQLIVVATRLLNERGVRAMTLADVATAAGMATTNVAYYFGKKEGLAAACFVSGVERLQQLVTDAAAEPTARARLTRLWRSYFDLSARIALGEAPDIPIFSDIRTLSEPLQAQTVALYYDYARAVRGLLRAPDLDWLRGPPAWARVRIILEQINWLRAWLPRFEVEDYPRLCERMLDILFEGLAAPDAARPGLPAWRLQTCGEEGPALEAFLVAATRQINEHGYKGASVNRISAVLKRTKGAFYHHLDSKDDLVIAGFERSFGVLRSAQSAALRMDGDAWTRLNAAVTALVAFQVAPEGQLVRTSAFQSLPEPMRQEMLTQSNRAADRFAGMIADGVAESVLRAVDPMIAAQMLTSSINAAADLQLFQPPTPAEDAVRLYATPILRGLFAGIETVHGC